MINTIIGVTALLAVIFGLMAIVWITVLSGLGFAYLFFAVVSVAEEQKEEEKE